MVTGGAGFIGSHLVGALIKKNYEVVVVDNLQAGNKKRLPAGVKLCKVDIRDAVKLTPIFRGAKFVFHTAALPRVQPSIKDPITTNDVNVNGTLGVLVAARDAEVKRVIYSSSSSVYGNQEKLPLREDMEPCPLSPYGLQKYIGELYCRLFSQVYDLETVCLRYFNGYGSDAPVDGDYALVIGKFCDQRKRSRPLTIVPDGRQSRDFTHVSDIVRVNILAAESAKVGKGEVINAGGGRNRTVLEVAKLIGGPTILVEPRIEAKHSLADIKKAKELLGWNPEISLEEGIGGLKKIYGLI